MPFRKTLDKTDYELAGGSGSTQSITTGDWNKVGTFTVPAQQRYAHGYGSAAQSHNQGYLYVLLQDNSTTPVEITGKVRLTQEDANGLEKRVVFEEQEEVLNGDKSDKNKKVPLPEQRNYPLVGEDSTMNIEFDPDADDTLSHDNSTVYIPVTVYA